MAGGYSNIHYFIMAKTKIFSWNPLLKNQIGYQEEPMKRNKRGEKTVPTLVNYM